MVILSSCKNEFHTKFFQKPHVKLAINSYGEVLVSGEGIWKKIVSTK